MRDRLAVLVWLALAISMAGPAAAQGSVGADSAGVCAQEPADQYADECATPTEGADAARDAARDSSRAVGGDGGSAAFGRAVEAAGVGNATVGPEPPTPQAERNTVGEPPEVPVLPETGGVTLSFLACGLFLPAGVLMVLVLVLSRRCRSSPGRGAGTPPTGPAG